MTKSSTFATIAVAVIIVLAIANAHNDNQTTTSSSQVRVDATGYVTKSSLIWNNVDDYEQGQAIIHANASGNLATLLSPLASCSVETGDSVVVVKIHVYDEVADVVVDSTGARGCRGVISLTRLSADDPRRWMIKSNQTQSSTQQKTKV